MMKYILDISGLSDDYLEKYPYLKPLPKQIPVKIGDYEKIYDVIEEEVGKDIMDEVKRIQGESHPYLLGEHPEWPIGFNHLPKGTILKPYEND